MNFNATFYFNIFALYFEHVYTIFPIYNLTSKKKVLNGKIFIKTSIYNKYNFKKLVEELYKHKNAKLRYNHEIKFIDFIAKFWLPDAKKNINEIVEVCKTILSLEIDKKVIETGYVVFEQNIPKPKWEYIMEVLEIHDKPMNLKEIRIAITHKYSDINFHEQQIAAEIHRSKNDRIVVISRTGYYALKKWEKEKDNFVGGSILKIIHKFLMQFDTPILIEEIVNHVQKYRNTTFKNVFENIYRYPPNKFLIINRSYIGLTEKKYNQEQLNLKHRKRMRILYSDLQKLIGEDINEIKNIFMEKYNYSKVQIDVFFHDKIYYGCFNISEDNKFIGIVNKKH